MATEEMRAPHTSSANMPALTRRNLLGTVAGLAAAPLVSALPFAPAQAAAPMHGLSNPGWARFRLGGFELTMVADSDAFIDGPFPIIGANASEAEVQQLMRDNLLPPARYQPGFTPMIVNTGKEVLIFDTGNGESGFIKRPSGGWLASLLGSAGFAPEQIDLVVLSHGHLDHVAGIMEGGKPLFPNARYVISGTEYDFWAPEGKHAGQLEQLAAVFRANVVPVAEKTRFLKPGEDVVTGIRSLEARGHTPGHLAFTLESNGERMLFWGDCAHHQVASLARPDWHCAFDIDKEQGAATRKWIYDMAASERIPVQGYHMPFPSLGYVERRPEGGYRWLAHTYQLSVPK